MASAHIKTTTTASGAKRYVVRWRPGGRASPTRHGGSFATKHEAELRLKAVRESLSQLREPDLAVAVDGAGNLLAAVDAYTESRVDLDAKTVRVYKQARARLGGLGRRVPRSVTVEDLQGWVRGLMDGDKALGPASIRAYLGVVRRTLDDRGVEPNPARSPRLRLPSMVVEEVQPPSAREVEAILDAAGPRYRFILAVLEATGLRVGELTQLRWGDVDFLGGRLRVARGRTKGGTRGRRFVPAGASVLDGVAGLCPLEDRRLDEHVFGGVTAGAVRAAMERACRDAGVPLYSPHDLRHRYISRLVLAGVPISRVRQVAGHARGSVTLDTYSHVLLDESVGGLEELRRLVG